MTNIHSDASLLATVALFRTFDRTFKDAMKALKETEAGDERTAKYDHMDELDKLRGACAREIFEHSAQTIEGVLEKLRIAHQATDEDGDAELLSHEDRSDPWMPKVIADLERLVGEE